MVMHFIYLLLLLMCYNVVNIPHKRQLLRSIRKKSLIKHPSIDSKVNILFDVYIVHLSAMRPSTRNLL